MISDKIHEKLKEIYQVKLQEIESIDIGSLPARQVRMNSFNKMIKEKKDLALIAEIKKASPSKGLIRQNFNLEHIVNEYNRLPADAISVLTDRQFFQGNIDYLGEVKEKTKVPVLRKDFIISEKQIHQSYCLGADMILLIVAMLSAEELSNFLQIADKLELDVLVEAHDLGEINAALMAGAKIIGVNNRDLNTFKVDLNNALDLAEHIPDNIIKVAESGMHSREDIKRVEQAGFDAVLIGEAFMAGADITSVYKNLFEK